jgi:MoaA/NifB/PqqE/SkfB family radical SAM enzyme
VTYITPTKVFAHLDRVLAWRAGQRPAPVTVEFDLSNRCTLGCQSCHFAHTHTRGPWAVRDRRLPMAFDPCGDLADPALVTRALGDMAALGVRGVVWSGGGEPTTHPQFLDIVETAASVGLAQGLYTLGGLLTQASAARLAARLSWAVVSLDCVDGATYAAEKGVTAARFDAACQGVRWLAEAGGVVVGVSFLLHANNWWRADEMVALGRSLGVTYTTLRPTIATSPDAPGVCSEDRAWVSEALPLLTRLAGESDVEVRPERFAAYRDWAGHGYETCRAIRLNTTVTPDGRVWVCPQHRGIPGSCIGDLRTEAFAAIWARQTGETSVGPACRVMCRLHEVNTVLAETEQPYRHEAFV